VRWVFHYASLSRKLLKKNSPWGEIATANPGWNVWELAPLHEETVRIQKIIDEEFEQIEPEDWT